MKYWKVVSFILVVLAMAVSMGSDSVSSHGGHGGGHGLDEKTIRTIIYQTINFVGVILILIYFLKARIKSFFKEKHTQFVGLAEKAEQMKKEAEEAHIKVQTQISTLDSTKEDTILRAKAEAADMRNRLIAEAEALSEKIKKEAQETAKNEIEKAKQVLREELLNQSIGLSEKLLLQIPETEKKRLQKEYIEEMKVVQK